MSLEFFIINPHLIPFFILFCIGIVLLVAAPLHYRWKTKSFPVFLDYRDFRKYNKFQRRALYFGFLFVFLGILGAAVITEEYGYNRVVFDIHGNKAIENSKTEPNRCLDRPIMEENLSETLRGITIIPGTWDWDIEQNQIGGGGRIDLWWSPMSESKRYLVPKNGTKISIVSDQPFEKIDEKYLKSLTLSGKKY